MLREQDLADYLLTQREPFRWQDNNCLHFVGRWAERREQLAFGAPPTLREGLRLMHELNIDAARCITAALKGRAPLASPLLAQTGDIVMVPQGGKRRWRLGIASGRTVAFLTESAASPVMFEREANLTQGAVAWRVL